MADRQLEFQKKVLQILIDIRDTVRIALRNTDGTAFNLKPANNNVEFLQIESRLEDKNERVALQAYLKRLGGVDYVDMVKKSMSATLSNAVMSQMNLKGKCGKLPFSKSVLCEIICDAVINTHNTTRSKILETMSKFLKYAPERIGGGGQPINWTNLLQILHHFDFDALVSVTGSKLVENVELSVDCLNESLCVWAVSISQKCPSLTELKIPSPLCGNFRHVICRKNKPRSQEITLRCNKQSQKCTLNEERQLSCNQMVTIHVDCHGFSEEGLRKLHVVTWCSGPQNVPSQSEIILKYPRLEMSSMNLKNFLQDFHDINCITEERAGFDQKVDSLLSHLSSLSGLSVIIISAPLLTEIWTSRILFLIQSCSSLTALRRRESNY
ncbi:putative NACHT [Triplophysa rosa]|uniref:NACHT n=1 Tax=Triplophysa rosa TaxID=992332 RepID=A0A9W7T324_TRIRA|nr:putative NACHT [Triplophysa rosa]